MFLDHGTDEHDKPDHASQGDKSRAEGFSSSLHGGDFVRGISDNGSGGRKRGQSHGGEAKGGIAESAESAGRLFEEFHFMFSYLSGRRC